MLQGTSGLSLFALCPGFYCSLLGLAPDLSCWLARPRPAVEGTSPSLRPFLHHACSAQELQINPGKEEFGLSKRAAEVRWGNSTHCHNFPLVTVHPETIYLSIYLLLHSHFMYMIVCLNRCMCTTYSQKKMYPLGVLVLHLMWMLGTKPGSSDGVTNALTESFFQSFI